MNTPLNVLTTILLTFGSSLFAANERPNVVWLFAEDTSTMDGNLRACGRSLKRESVQIRIRWHDHAKSLTLEPHVGQETERTFTVDLLPSGKTKKIRYTGKRIEVVCVNFKN
jgi:hypothetical protein